MLTLQQLVQPFQRQQDPVLFHGNGAEPLQHVRGFHHHSWPVLLTSDRCSRKISILRWVRMHLWLVYNQAWGHREKQIEMFITLRYSNVRGLIKCWPRMQTDGSVILPWLWAKLDLDKNTVKMIPLTGKIPLGCSLTGSAACYVMQQNKCMLFKGLINSWHLSWKSPDSCSSRVLLNFTERRSGLEVELTWLYIFKYNWHFFCLELAL